MTAHINVLVRALIYISALVLVDSRTFKYCFNITRPGNNLDTMTIDHFTMYTARLQSWALFAEISGAESLGKIGAGA